MYSDLSITACTLTCHLLYLFFPEWDYLASMLAYPFSVSVGGEREREVGKGGGVRDARQTKNNGGPTMEVCNKMVPRVYDDDFNDDVGKEEG